MTDSTSPYPQQMGVPPPGAKYKRTNICTEGTKLENETCAHENKTKTDWTPGLLK